tara:strand:+ start:489 stop:743 length:255 start_codon:yes stop_codon:yes gene_type:complete
MAMWYETKKMALYDGEGDSCAFDPSILDNLNETIQYKIPNNKTKGKKKEPNEKTISKMFHKKLTRYVDKKHKSNIKRKTSEYHF